MALVSVTDLFARGGQVYRQSLARCLPLSLLAVLAGQAPTVYLLAQGESLALDRAKPLGWYLVMALAVAVNVWCWLWLLRRQRNVLTGETSSLVAEARAAASRVPQALGLLLLGLGIIVLGGVLLVVPGLYLAVALVPALAIQALEDHRPLAVIDLALRRVRGRWWYTATVLMLTLIAMLGLFVLGGFVGWSAGGFAGTPAPAWVSSLLAALFQPFITAILVMHHDALLQPSSPSNSA